MKHTITVILTAAVLWFAGCAGKENTVEGSFQSISQEEAKQMMTKDDGHIIVDVRRQDEYEEGHIPGAILISNETIETERPKELPDLSQIILIYCRSGNRSKQAAEKLAKMGYTNLYEFGGIMDWTGEIEKPDYDAIADAMRPVAELVIEADGKQLRGGFADNASADALKETLSHGAVTLELHDHEGFEKTGSLTFDLPFKEETFTPVPGDLILYEGNQIALVYDEPSGERIPQAKLGSVSAEEFGNDTVTVTMWAEWSE